MELYPAQIQDLERQLAHVTGQRNQLAAALSEVRTIALNARYRPTSVTTLQLIEKITRDVWMSVELGEQADDSGQSERDTDHQSPVRPHRPG